MNAKLLFMLHSCQVNECFVENDYVHVYQRYVKTLILKLQHFSVML